MRALVQRVSRAAVDVGGERVAEIGPGLLVLLGVMTGDAEREADALAGRLARLRVFPDEHRPMNVDVRAAGGEVLLVSQFTLAADTSRGNRPSFVSAARPEIAEPLYLRVAEQLRAAGVPTSTGVFGASMAVSLVNDGPVTIPLEVAPRAG